MPIEASFTTDQADFLAQGYSVVWHTDLVSHRTNTYSLTEQLSVLSDSSSRASPSVKMGK